MGRFARSWELSKASMRVLRQDKELLWMPVLSFLATAVATAAIVGVGWVSGVWPSTIAPDGGLNVPGVALAFAYYLVLAFIGVFFGAAVVAGATERLKGGDPTVGSALRAAAAKAGKIFLWACVVATVNVILQAVRERSGTLGRILTSVAGMAWNLATYFIVPVLLFENAGIGESVRRSGSLFKRTWGETVIGEAGVNLAGVVIGAVAVVLGILLTVFLSGLAPVAGLAIGLALTVVAFAVVTAYFSALGGVYKAAMYRYAATGEAAPGFAPEQLRGAFHPR